MNNEISIELNGNDADQTQENTEFLLFNAQKVTDMANGNEQNGNGTAQAQQGTSILSLNAQEYALLLNATRLACNGMTQAQQDNAIQIFNAQEEVAEATEQEQEEMIFTRSYIPRNPKLAFKYKVDTVHTDYLNNIDPKITRKKLNLSKAEYRDLFYAVCLIYGEDYEMPSEAKSVHKATSTERGILISRCNLENMGADEMFAKGTLVIPSYDATNNCIIIKPYDG